MTLQLILTADNHLDVSAARFGPRRFERKDDFLRSFSTVVDHALKDRPDALLIAGDLFDSIQPRNVVRNHLMKVFRDLHDHSVRVFLIGGHHDIPRSVEHGSSPLAIYGESGYCRFFGNYSEVEREYFDLDGLKIQVAGVSFNPLLQPGDDPLRHAKLTAEADVNVLMAHYSIEGFAGFFPGTEPTVRSASIPSGFHLLAAGHLHRNQERTVNNCFVTYPGSTERVSFSEEAEDKGYLWIELDTQGLVRREFIPTPSRPMITVDIEVPEDGNVGEVIDRAIVRQVDPQALLRLRVRGPLRLNQLAKYSRPRIQAHLSQKFFAAIVDDSALEIETQGQIRALPKTTPMQEVERYFESLIGKATAEEIEALREAKQMSLKMLQEAGAW